MINTILVTATSEWLLVYPITKHANLTLAFTVWTQITWKHRIRVVPLQKLVRKTMAGSVNWGKTQRDSSRRCFTFILRIQATLFWNLNNLLDRVVIKHNEGLPLCISTLDSTNYIIKIFGYPRLARDFQRRKRFCFTWSKRLPWQGIFFNLNTK